MHSWELGIICCQKSLKMIIRPYKNTFYKNFKQLIETNWVFFLIQSNNLKYMKLMCEIQSKLSSNLYRPGWCFFQGITKHSLSNSTRDTRATLCFWRYKQQLLQIPSLCNLVHKNTLLSYWHFFSYCLHFGKKHTWMRMRSR